MNEFTKIKDRILARIENYIADIELAEEKELTEDEKTIFASVKHIINEEFQQPIPLPRFIIHADGKMEQIKTSGEKEPRLSKPAFTVIDYVLAAHEGKFTTFCDGKHKQITTKQIKKELDKLYDYYYKKGAESGEGIE